MPLLRPKPPKDVLKDLAKDLAAVETIFQHESVPPELRKTIRRFVRRTNWRRRLYLRFYPRVKPAKINAWISQLSETLLNLEEDCERSISDKTRRRNCLAILERLENTINQLEDGLQIPMSKAA